MNNRSGDRDTLSRPVRRASVGARFAALLALTVSAVSLTGCGGGGNLVMASESDANVTLSAEFNTGVYSYGDDNTVSIVLLDGSVQQPRQAVHIRMHWQPWPARTPIDSRATNATVRYVVFSGDAAGVYSGAGFLFPRDTPGAQSFSGDLRDTAMRLADASETFEDKLGLARVTGGFTVQRDNGRTLDLIRKLQSRVRQQLGYPAFVQRPADEQAEPTPFSARDLRIATSNRAH